MEETTKQNDPQYILLEWDEKLGEHRQILLQPTLNNKNPNKVYLSKVMRLQNTYEEEQNNN